MSIIPTPLPEWDYPPCKNTLNYIVCSIPRTGSNLLCYTLAQQRNAGVPLEYFNLSPNQMSLAKRLGFNFDEKEPYHQLFAQLKAYSHRLQQFRSTPNGAFGVKVHWLHFDLLFERQPTPRFLETVFEQPKLIFMHRKDRVAQAVSYYFADESQQWFAQGSEAVFCPPYNYQRLLELIKVIRYSEEGWLRYLETVKHLPVMKICYEDLVADFEHTVKNVYDFLGIDTNALDLKPPIAKQSHSLKDEYAERFTKQFLNKS